MKKDFPITELPSKNSVSIDKLSTFEGLKLMLEDQKKAVLAVEKNLPNLKKVVEKIYSHLKTYPNGRLIYCGAEHQEELVFKMELNYIQLLDGQKIGQLLLYPGEKKL